MLQPIKFQRPQSEAIELGELGLNMAVYGILTAVGSAFLAAILELILSLFFGRSDSNLRYYVAIVIIWLALNVRFFFMLYQIRVTAHPVQNKKNQVRIFETSVAAFVWAYGLFYSHFPFEGNASPEDLDKFFGPILIILSFYRTLIISMFFRATKAMDYAILAFLIITFIVKVVLN